MSGWNFGELRGHVRTALISDALDGLGFRHQCLGPGIGPLDPSTVIVGRAFTVEVIEAERPSPNPYLGLLRALEAVGRDEVFVYPTGRSNRAAVWGELVSTSCLARGVQGVVTDGLIRDSARIRDLRFPAFARGTSPLDVDGRLELISHGIAVQIDGVAIRPGDIIVGDADGVAVIPAEIEDDVLRAALTKDGHEAAFREAVAAGRSPLDAFRQFGVL